MPQLDIADTFGRRAIGLIGRGRLDAGQGLLIQPCRMIHTFFMRFTLDLIFLDRTQHVVKVVRNTKPGRIVWGGGNACSVVETQSGWLPPVEKGDLLLIA